MNPPSRKFGLALALALVASSAAALPEDREQPIHLEASRGQLDQKTGVSVYEGNVVISQGSMRLTADTATIHVKDSSFERMEAVGKPVNLRYKPAVDKPEILGTSQRVEYNVGSAKVVMSGNARLVQGQDVFAGDRVEYDLKGDVVRARGAGTNGRIQFTIQPRGQSLLPAAKKP
ncbi:MAG: lipopolysaccharide transport periplasmic protein LptA [Candidatus Competibacteraceae bacterium]|nr:MAG: lipopolysaccharide transport periplasmic protein LptA [Candidatus Competibacteraceae bacterium]